MPNKIDTPTAAQRTRLKDWLKFPFILLGLAVIILMALPVLFCRAWARIVDNAYREMNSDR